MRLDAMIVRDVGKRVYTLVIDDTDWCLAHFDGFDLAVLRDCEKDDATIADKLLGLELVARRIQEGKERADRTNRTTESPSDRSSLHANGETRR